MLTRRLRADAFAETLREEYSQHRQWDDGFQAWIVDAIAKRDTLRCNSTADRLLDLIAENPGPLRHQDAADSLGCKISAVTRSLHRLIEGGYIRCTSHGARECSFQVKSYEVVPGEPNN